ncbi:helix-turn-helix domain-containing protein [Paenibacillus albidus]|uniref:AraC family transcriptional regulator n=1 Tax=Paenibacillus albidus TaxID=2041023 RepID=UPI001BEB6EF3|nr:AraC family transcriptional regulator [Paenibacillus albidus]MBT2293698.1 helix-turn-helix domain-containing protein [Paenibacillus albidus]
MKELFDVFWEKIAISLNTTDSAEFSEEGLSFWDIIRQEGGVFILPADLFMEAHEKITFIKHPLFIPMEEHKHDFLELTYAYKGNFTQIINGKSLYMREGDITLLDLNIVHKIIETDSKDSVVINILMKEDYFNEQLLMRLSQNNIFLEFLISALYRTSLKGNYLYFSPGNNQKIKTYIDSIIDEMKNNQLGAQELINCNTIMLFTELMRTLKDETSLNFEKEPNEKSSVSVFALIQFINEHFMELSLEQTAKHFHINPRYLARLLKKYSGKGYMEMVQELRLEKAVILLQNSQLNINEVAEKCGFSNMNNFYKLFKKRYNKTPKEYRKA